MNSATSGATSTVPTVTLNDGNTMPQLGFGVWRVPNDEVTAAVSTAIEAGYRSVDTAALYRNESGVGAALAAAAVPREELFVTTKLWNSDHGYDSAMRAFDASLHALGLDYLDLYLIHWPAPDQDRYLAAWRGLEKLCADGRVRSIGVCNFHEQHLRRLFEETDTVPAINQIELHPNLSQAPLRRLHAEHGITTEAWSPLAHGQLVGDPTIGRIAGEHGKSPAQVILRWHLQLGNVVIPKSVTPARIRENLEVFDFELSERDVAAIAELENGRRYGPDPEQFS